MKTIEIDIQHALSFTGREAYDSLSQEAVIGIENLESNKGAGSDYHGWVTLPSDIPVSQLEDIKATAASLQVSCDYVVCVGIGGSYLGAKAVIEALDNSFASFMPRGKYPKVLFAGQNIGEDYMAELRDFLSDKRFGIVVVSKSGTTTEPAIAFRLLKEQLEKQVGRSAAKDLIVAVTDASRGALRTLASQEGYKTYVIPDNVGGRFSVLTPVGLLPIAVAGFDIDRLVAGAVSMMEKTRLASSGNPAQTYAMMRNALYRDGKKIEILVNYKIGRAHV